MNLLGVKGGTRAGEGCGRLTKHDGAAVCSPNVHPSLTASSHAGTTAHENDAGVGFGFPTQAALLMLMAFAAHGFSSQGAVVL